jgi:hypothetical protein
VIGRRRRILGPGRGRAEEQGTGEQREEHSESIHVIPSSI